MENETLCAGLYTYNRGSALQTVDVVGCPVIHFILHPSPAVFQPFMGVSIQIPPLIANLTFSYYSNGTNGLAFTYSNVCDRVVNAALGFPVITTPLACPALITNSKKHVVQQLLTPAAAGLPDATYLNIVFLNVPADAVVYISEFSLQILAGPVIVLGPCPTIDEFPLAVCLCGGTCTTQ